MSSDLSIASIADLSGPEMVIPDLMMLGMDDPHGRPADARPPTVGQLAARVRDLAGRPADWWHLVSFETREAARVRLDSVDPEIEMWLTIWPPGHRTRVHEHRSAAKVTVVLGGELVEVALTEQGATERPLRANRVRVHGGGHLHELANPGPAFAISLHAELLDADADSHSGAGTGSRAGAGAAAGRPVPVSDGASD